MAKRYKFSKGTTITNTDDAYSIDLISVKLPDVASEEIEDTVITDSVMKTIASGFKNAGEVVLEVPWEPDNQVTVGDDDQTWTITLPLYSGDSTPNTITGTGHVTAKTQPALGTDANRLTQQITVKCNSEWAFNETN